MNVEKLIDQYGDKIAKQLQIASSQVYEKVLWYVRVDGVIGLVSMALGLLVFIVGGRIIYRECKAYFNKDSFFDNEEKFAVLLLFQSIWFVFSCFIGAIFHETVVAQIAKIVVPEYWIIHEIIGKAGS